MPYLDVLVHRAVPYKVAEDPADVADWAEGEPDDAPDPGADPGDTPSGDPQPGTGFDCCLFLPLVNEEDVPRGRRTVKRPTLLVAPRDDAGGIILLMPGVLLDVTAPELTGPDPIRWRVNGYSQPFGKPGEPLIGRQVVIKQVD